MQTVEVRRVDVDTASLIGQGAPPSEPSVRGPVRVVDADSGEAIAYVLRPELPSNLRAAFLAYPMDSTLRANIGVKNVSRVFGYGGRQPMLQRYACAPCGGYKLAPGPHAVIADTTADVLAAAVRDADPDRADHDAAVVRERVLPDWRMGESWWTSGVLNHTSPMPYHRDGNNLKAWSAMVTLRRGVRGGHLHLPEYDLTLPCRDGDVTWFPGWGLVHGVTPLHRTGNGYRFSAVYYAVRTMAHCLPPDEEIEHAKRARTEAETNWRARQAAVGLFE